MDKKPVLVLNDLIADVAFRIPAFPLNAGDLPKVSYLEIGPGGATNIAIMARRFGLPVTCLGEMGDDAVGQIVRQGLQREQIDTRHILINPSARTPVAGVLVDPRGEPAYLGYPGELHLDQLPESWRALLTGARALFADGWIERQPAADMILDAFQTARHARVPTFFDPGPGNPPLDNTWHRRAAALATVLLLNEQEAQTLTGESNPRALGRALLENGSQLVLLKRGSAGCMLFSGHDVLESAAFPVALIDATGAGDSVTGAVIYGFLRGLTLAELGMLANATGAAKVAKLGTGHNMPTLAEIGRILDAASLSAPRIVPSTRE